MATPAPSVTDPTTSSDSSSSCASARRHTLARATTAQWTRPGATWVGVQTE